MVFSHFHGFAVNDLDLVITLLKFRYLNYKSLDWREKIMMNIVEEINGKLSKKPINFMVVYSIIECIVFFPVMYK